MTNEAQISLENKFLAMITLYPDKVIDAIQIKSFYFTNSVNQKLFDLLKEEYEEKGIIDTDCINNKLQRTEVDHFINVTTVDTPLNDILKHFEEIQKELFINYKKRLTDDIYTKYKSGKITFENYLQKLDIIQDALIEDEDGLITEEEINNNIDDDKVRIPLKNFPKLDAAIGLVQNDFLVIGANTGTGKSALLINFMNDLMDRFECIYFNIEMSKSTIYKRMISIRASVPVNDVSKPKTDYQANLINTAKKDYVNNEVRILHRISKLEDIEKFIRRRKNKNKKHTIVFIDHIGLIENSDGKSIYERLTSTLQKLRQMCFRYDCTIIAASQLSRASYNAEKLNLSMLKDSGEVENSASKVILLSRAEGYSKDCLEPEMTIDVSKNRDGLEAPITAIYTKTKQIFKEKGYADR